MNKLFAIADRYIADSDWKVMAVLKFCLLAMGIIIGILLPEKARKAVLAVCIPVFVITYIPLMAKFVQAAKLESLR